MSFFPPYSTRLKVTEAELFKPTTWWWRDLLTNMNSPAPSPQDTDSIDHGWGPWICIKNKERKMAPNYVRLLWSHELYIACQFSTSLGFSKQEYWSGLPFPSPGELPDPGIEPRSPTLQADALPAAAYYIHIPKTYCLMLISATFELK